MSGRLTLTAVAAGVALFAAAPAQASDAGIRDVVNRYAPRLSADEQSVTAALSSYERSGDPAAPQAAIARELSDLTAFRSAVIAQPAVLRRVRLGRRELVRGLTDVLGAYRKLSRALGEKATRPAAARTVAARAAAQVARGRTELSSAEQLL